MSERWQVLPQYIGRPKPSAGVGGATLRTRADAHEAVARLAAHGWGGFTIECHERAGRERWLIAADPPLSAGKVFFSLMPFAGPLRTAKDARS